MKVKLTSEELEKVVTACYTLIDFLLEQEGSEEQSRLLSAVREVQWAAEHAE